MPIPMAQVLRLYCQMFLSYGLYVCIILETAHHRTTFRLFSSITQNTTTEENSHKNIPYFFTNCTFLYEFKDILEGIWITFHWKGAKERGKRPVLRNKPKMRVSFAKFPLLNKIQTLSHKRLVRQTSNYHHCNWHAQKSICIDFQVILSNSSWSKQLSVFLRTNMAFKCSNGLILQNLHFVNICLQWPRWCRQLQQGDWYFQMWIENC